MYINYHVQKGIEYAAVTKSVRSGKKVEKADRIYLGRVIDKSRGIFKNKERGLFVYDIKTNTFGKVPADFIEPKVERKTKYPVRPILSVAFGDVFVLDKFIDSIGFSQAIDAIGYRNGDTLHALLAYYILSPHANCHAEDWFELSYAKYLYPKAQLASQRISEALVDIGSEAAKRDFFKAYLAFLELNKDVFEKNAHAIEDGVLIDSAGMPNAIKTALTMTSNHNGEINEEIRLIYVVQQHTGMPLFFRYVAGNIIDVSTVIRTIAELKKLGVNTKFAILDAGYYTEVNADTLLDAGISFVTRLKSNLRVYKDVVDANLAGLEARENLVVCGKRVVYVKCVPCKIGQKHDRPAYAYVCKDTDMQHVRKKSLVEKAIDLKQKGPEVYDELQSEGVFVLVSSRKIAIDKILPTYYTRDQIEKIFEICKQEGKLMPLNVESEAALRGHLMMTFMAAAIIKMLGDKLAQSGITTESAFMNLHEQHGNVYDTDLITTEPQRKMNEAYKALGIECPVTVKLPKAIVD